MAAEVGFVRRHRHGLHLPRPDVAGDGDSTEAGATHPAKSATTVAVRRRRWARRCPAGSVRPAIRCEARGRPTEAAMHVLRTPDERFASLPGFDFEPHYVEVRDGIRVHYLDEGPAGADPVLLMHGEPSWCFLYRKMIPVLVAAGHRCVAPDLVGFGRSDKPGDHGRLQLPGPRGLDERGPLRAASTCATSPSSDRTGAGSSGSGWSPPTRTGSRRWWWPTPGCRPGTRPPTEAFLALADTSPGRPRPSRSVGSSRAAAPTGWPTTSSPPTTRRSPTTPTRRGRGSSPPSCRPRRTTPPTTPTSPRGRC